MDPAQLGGNLFGVIAWGQLSRIFLVIACEGFSSPINQNHGIADNIALPPGLGLVPPPNSPKLSGTLQILLLIVCKTIELFEVLHVGHIQDRSL